MGGLYGEVYIHVVVVVVVVAVVVVIVDVAIVSSTVWCSLGMCGFIFSL